jgi:hypothetical protein
MQRCDARQIWPCDAAMRHTLAQVAARLMQWGLVTAPPPQRSLHEQTHCILKNGRELVIELQHETLVVFLLRQLSEEPLCIRGVVETTGLSTERVQP